jgi:creatinine amidohydrolase
VGARLVFFLCLFPAPFAAAASSLFLEELTWTEVRELVKSGHTTILVPIGGTEQNGPHIVLGKHNVRAKLLAEKIAKRLGKTLIAPTIAYVPEGRVDPPTEHMRYPGTVSIPDDVFEKTLEAIARSFRAHGFRDIVVLGDHGGYRKSLTRVAQRLNREWSSAHARIHELPEYYQAAATDFPALLKQQGKGSPPKGEHAGLADTSLTLAVDPSLVRSELLSKLAGDAQGIKGDARGASAELGRAGVDLIVERTVEAIRRALQR